MSAFHPSLLLPQFPLSLSLCPFLRKEGAVHGLSFFWRRRGGWSSFILATGVRAPHVCLGVPSGELLRGGVLLKEGRAGCAIDKSLW